LSADYHQQVGGEIQAPPVEHVSIGLFASGTNRQSAKGNTMEAPREAQQRELTDADVVRLAQQDDADAFERIYRSHSQQVYALCLRMVGDPTAAEALTQIRQNSYEVPDVKFEGSLGHASYTWAR
jgi:hypothetical protein